MSAAKHIRQMTAAASLAPSTAQAPQAATMSRAEYQRAVTARTAAGSQAEVASGAYSAQQASAYAAPARQPMAQVSALSGTAAQPAAQQAAQPAAQIAAQPAAPQAVPATPQSIPVTPRSSSPALNREAAQIAEWIGQVRFKPKAFGGVDEADVWRKFGELNDRYEAALRSERARYDALLAERLAQQANIGTTRRAPAPHSARDPAYAGRRA